MVCWVKSSSRAPGVTVLCLSATSVKVGSFYHCMNWDNLFSVIIGHQTQKGTNSLHHGCSLVLLLLLIPPWYCARSLFINVLWLHAKCSQTAPEWPLAERSAGSSQNCRCLQWLWPCPRSVCPYMGTGQMMDTPRGFASEWLHSGQESDSVRGALFGGQRQHTAALCPSGNNDTAEPIDISKNFNKAAASSPQWHSMALQRGHDVAVSEAVLEYSLYFSIM